MLAKIEQKQNIFLEPSTIISDTRESMTENPKSFKKQTLNLPVLLLKKRFKEKYDTYAKKKACNSEQYRIILLCDLQKKILF